jgi:hypothetical protein
LLRRQNASAPAGLQASVRDEVIQEMPPPFATRGAVLPCVALFHGSCQRQSLTDPLDRRAEMPN